MSLERMEKNGDAVFISVHESLIANEFDNHSNNCEVIWAEEQTQGRPIIIGASNRPPSVKESSLMDPAFSLHGIRNKQNNHIVLGGGISSPHIYWKKKSTMAG